MINKVSFKNYKGFKEKQTLELKPITVLFGKNNSGKSAILKLPTLIAGSLSGNFSQPFQQENEGVKIANEYKDIVYGRAFKEVEIEVFQKDVASKVEDFLRTEIFIDDNEPIIESWNCNNKFDLLRNDGNNYFDRKTKRSCEAYFEGINLKSIDSIGEKDIQLPIFKINTDFIGAIRQEALQNYSYSSNIPEKSGINGDNLYQFLIEDYQTTNKFFFTQISEWIREKFEGWELKIEVDGYKREIPALIKLQKKKLDINISQTGMGISQVLPLIIRAYKPCKDETLIIIEEPESHLHPYAHAQVAQLFFESLELDKNKKYLIETHSQNFILRMRRLIAEGKLHPSEFALYYVEFDEDKNESILKPIEVDEFGRVDTWPDNIFSETLEESIGIRTAQLKK